MREKTRTISTESQERETHVKYKNLKNSSIIVLVSSTGRCKVGLCGSHNKKFLTMAEVVLGYRFI